MDLDVWRDRRDHCIAVFRQWISDDLVKEAIQWGVEVPDQGGLVERIYICQPVYNESSRDEVQMVE